MRDPGAGRGNVFPGRTAAAVGLVMTLLLMGVSFAWAQSPATPSTPGVQEVPVEQTPPIASPSGQATQPVPSTAPVEDARWDLGSIWSASLFTVGGQKVTVGQLLTVVLVALLGLWLSVMLTRIVRRYLLRTGRLTANAAGIVSNLLFYLLVIIIVLQAMMMVGIPLATFAFLGGALAIGLGFGAQNILNNFISGLILMLERPIRIGDLIEVDGNLGTVEHVGGRCTRVRRVDGVDTLVPNSTLLENNVVNWTLSDRDVRTSVTVGVAYGSPVEKVAQLIRQAVDEESEVLRQPEPIVLFQDFGDNALAFEVFFWVRVGRPMDMRMVRSAIRFRIDALFREAEIVIAFPQRDVHLDSLLPLQVRLIDERRGEGTQ